MTNWSVEINANRITLRWCWCRSIPEQLPLSNGVLSNVSNWKWYSPIYSTSSRADRDLNLRKTEHRMCPSPINLRNSFSSFDQNRSILMDTKRKTKTMHWSRTKSSPCDWSEAKYFLFLNDSYSILFLSFVRMRRKKRNAYIYILHLFSWLILYVKAAFSFSDKYNIYSSKKKRRKRKREEGFIYSYSVGSFWLFFDGNYSFLKQ